MLRQNPGTGSLRRRRLLLNVVVATLCLHTALRLVGQSKKDPKLSSLLVELRDTPLVQSSFDAADTRETQKSVEALPHSLQDAIHSGALRFDRNGNVQTYIEVESISQANLTALGELGITVEVIGEPSAHQSRSEVYSVVPTVEAMVPVRDLSKLENLPFVRYVRLPVLWHI
jgi:hypothetical protein